MGYIKVICVMSFYCNQNYVPFIELLELYENIENGNFKERCILSRESNAVTRYTHIYIYTGFVIISHGENNQATFDMLDSFIKE